MSRASNVIAHQDGGRYPQDEFLLPHVPRDPKVLREWGNMRAVVGVAFFHLANPVIMGAHLKQPNLLATLTHD